MIHLNGYDGVRYYIVPSKIVAVALSEGYNFVHLEGGEKLMVKDSVEAIYSYLKLTGLVS